MVSIEVESEDNGVINFSSSQDFGIREGESR